MDQQQPALPQQAPQTNAWAPFYGAAFMQQYMQPQLQQLAEAQWKLELSMKLAAVLEKLHDKFAHTQCVCLCQTWVGADGCESANPTVHEVTLWADPRLAIVLDPLFHDLRFKSCQGPVFFRNSMPGKVWRSGAVQIVQNLRILPPSLHPRSQLTEEALNRLAEALYIPIYDLGRASKGQVCVLEVLLSTRATEAMLVADVISTISVLLTERNLSLANPVHQPVRRSVLCGRRARAQDSDGEASDDEAGASGSGGNKQRRGSGPEAAGTCGQQQQRQAACGASGSGNGSETHVSVPPTQDAQGAEGGAQPQVAGCCAAQAACTTEGAAASTRQAETGAAVEDSAAPCTVGAGTSADGGEGRSTKEKAGTNSEEGGGDGGTAAGPLPTRAVAACGAAAEVVAPTCSEQPTLPASPSHERVTRVGELVAAAVGSAVTTTAAGCGAESVSGGEGSPRVLRKRWRVVETAMLRSKSVASVAALSDGLAADGDDE